MMKASRLTCEFRIEPIGIDARYPRLGWIVETPARGEKQTAYRILVASTGELLAADGGDLWDSGKVPGDRTSMVSYQGRPLVSHQACFWKVMTWDSEGKPGPWSAPSTWSMGILDPKDWRADWIGHDAPRTNEGPRPFATSHWIWNAEEEPMKATAGTRAFARTFDIPPGRQITIANLAVAASGSYSLFINGRAAASFDAHPGAGTNPQYLEASQLLRLGANSIYAEVQHPVPGPAGLNFWLRVMYGGGESDTFVSNGSWRSAPGPNEHWKTDGPRPGDGSPAKSVGVLGTPPWGILDGSMLLLPPPRYLGTRAAISKPVKRAVLYATALGLCDVYLNNHRISDDYFTPGWTDYAKRVYYRAYDVTPLVRPGANTLGAILADGWYSGHIGWHVKRDHYGPGTRFKAQLHVEFEDGSSEEIGTGRHWRAWRGPTTQADFLMGEAFDARLGKGGFVIPHDGNGDPVDVGAEHEPLLQSHPAPAVRSYATLTPRSITEPQPGVYVFDMGQNFAGIARLKVREKRGQNIILRFAERLNPDGTIYTRNLRGARAVDTYICDGNGIETWEPRFTFHGFQFVEVSGLSEPPSTETITGIALSSDTPPAAEFSCSDPMINQLASNINWTQRSNFIDVPTDCPQRDERLGWTGDAQVYIRSACLQADVQAFFHKWLVDLADAQRPDGQFPRVAPLMVGEDDGGPAWADAGVICPWTVYEVYGDTSILEQHYPAMAKFVDFCRRRSTPGLLPPKEFHCFGDWLNIDANTPHDVIYTAYFARCAALLANAAAVLGRKGDAEEYGNLFESIRVAFTRAYVDAEGRIKGNTQTGYVLALAFGLLDPPASDMAARHLVADIKSRGWHLSTGFIGTKELMGVLSAIGRTDVAYRLLHNETFPSWGFTIRNGATSIWERWDGWTPERGFQDPGMNSFAHYSFGAVYQWMVETIGGIMSDGPGFRKLIIAPQPGGSLAWARVMYHSVAGPIRSGWTIADGRTTVTIDIPANTSARIRLPGVAGPVLESGKPAGEHAGLKALEDGTFTAGSGHFEFSYPSRK